MPSRATIPPPADRFGCARAIPSDGPAGASCRPVRFCVVVDSGGNATAGTLAGPTVVTGAATVASQTTAQVGASVDAHDANVVGCRFDYGLTTAYGRSAACSPMPPATGGSAAVSGHLNGLAAATTYHFRVTATSGVATAAGGDAVLTTPAPLTASPSLTGTAAVGFVLTCNANIPAATTPTPPTMVAFAWLADTTPIANATRGYASGHPRRRNPPPALPGFDLGRRRHHHRDERLRQHSRPDPGEGDGEPRWRRHARLDLGESAGHLLASGGRHLRAHAAPDGGAHHPSPRQDDHRWLRERPAWSPARLEPSSCG